MLAGDGPGRRGHRLHEARARPDRPVRARRPFVALGTDGFGRSDTREALRRFFEIDAGHVVVTVLSELAALGCLEASVVQDAIEAYGIDAEAPDPAAATTISSAGVRPAPWEPRHA